MIKRAIAGDQDAFGNLYQNHMDAIYRYIFFRVGDTNDAEDLTEQTFLRAWESLPGYRPGEHPFSSWLYRIAHNLVVDHHRRRRPTAEIDSIEQNSNLENQAGAFNHLTQAEDTIVLAQAIRQLPDEQQQVIILRFIEGLSHNEVAHILNKSDGACRMIQARALAALNDQLKLTQGS
jgi:RNA polymerase sigma-70 factor (ECF subfamily)